jgi:hypothetical protein
MSLAARNALIALAVTIVVVGTVIYAVNYLDQRRVVELSSIQDQLATDTLSVETQFALLEEAPCEYITESNTLSATLADLGARLVFAEERLGATDPQVLQLKKQYTLLQIRDYLLMKRLARVCEAESPVALYFYSNVPGDCADCNRASYALSYLHETYPNLRVYSFDYNLDLGALKTLIAVEKVRAEFPAFVIEGKRSYGFSSLDALEKEFPKGVLVASTTASTTQKGR